MITIPDFLTFLADNAAIGVLALVAWIFVVAAVVWLGEKAVKKFRQRLSRTATQADASVSSVAGASFRRAGRRISHRRAAWHHERAWGTVSAASINSMLNGEAHNLRTERWFPAP
jgi:hypothetical protein